LLPHPFFLSIGFAMAPPLTRTMHDHLQRWQQGKSPFWHPAHPSLTLLTLTSSIITLLFLSRSNGMTTDIGFLAAGLNGHVVRIGITKNIWKPQQSFLGALPFHCRISLSNLLIKAYQLFTHTLPLLSLILLNSLAVFVHLHLLSCYSSLAFPTTTRCHLQMSLKTASNIVYNLAL
jgi:hypothetical protein